MTRTRTRQLPALANVSTATTCNGLQTTSVKVLNIFKSRCAIAVPSLCYRSAIALCYHSAIALLSLCSVALLSICFQSPSWYCTMETHLLLFLVLYFESLPAVSKEPDQSAYSWIGHGFKICRFLPLPAYSAAEDSIHIDTKSFSSHEFYVKVAAMGRRIFF